MNIFRRKTTKTEDASTQSAPRSIYDIARTVKDRFDEVAHPSELNADATWNAAVRELSDSALTTQDLLTFSLRENAAVAALALATLGARGDGSAVAPILDHLNNYTADWPKFFALHALELLVPAPNALLGRVFVAMDDDWADRRYERFLVQFVRELTRRRIREGEPATFAGALENASASRLSEVRALLRVLDSELVAPMRDELKAHEREQVDTAFLRSIGTIHGEDTNPPIAHELLVTAATFIEQTLAAERRRSVLVVGEDGVGKTTVIRAAAERLRERGWIVFEAGVPELLAGMSFIGEMEERMQKVIKQLGGRRVAWIIPRLHELVHTGAHRSNPNGIIDWVLPEIDNGSLAVISEIDHGAYEKLIQQKPRVRTAFVTARVEPLPERDTLALARRWAAAHAPSMSSEVLAEAWQLTTQYLGRRAPGNLLGLLQATHARLHAMHGGSEIAITLDDILATLAQLTGLPQSVLDDREGLDLAQLRAHFGARVLGQSEAIEVLVERVAMLKAGVTDPSRALGVFLFAGPTGTGKTEVAKSLAEYLFGSADRMIRLDMSEFKNADSLGRLIGDSDGNVESLVSSIRKQPFSVVLLDELEKAHPNVWDLFLQVFDDGRLTDQRGVTADFRHAIIIMTSNVGAAIQTGGRAGFSEAAPAFHASNVAKALEREFRKEFINRIDRVVVFRPLSRDTMRGILRKEIAAAFKRRGLRNRSWAVEWEESAIEFLLNEGFTADLGARPLKRAVERHLLTPLAELIVTRRVPTGDQFLFIRAENDRLAIDFVDPDATPAAAVEVPPPDEDFALESLVLHATGNASELARLHREFASLRIVVESAEWSERKQIALSMTSLPEFWSSPDRFEILGEAELRDRIESALSGARSLLERLHDRAPSDLVRRVAQQLWLIGIAIDDVRERRPSDAAISIEARTDVANAGAANEWAQRVAGMYRSWARTRGMRAEVVSERHQPYGVTIAVSGFAAHTILAREHGLHVLEVQDGHTITRVNARVRVASDVEALANANGDAIVVRRYRDAPSPLVRDSIRNWRTGRVDLVLRGAFDVIR